MNPRSYVRSRGRSLLGLACAASLAIILGGGLVPQAGASSNSAKAGCATVVGAIDASLFAAAPPAPSTVQAGVMSLRLRVHNPSSPATETISADVNVWQVLNGAVVTNLLGAGPITLTVTGVPQNASYNAWAEIYTFWSTVDGGLGRGTWKVYMGSGTSTPPATPPLVVGGSCPTVTVPSMTVPVTTWPVVEYPAPEDPIVIPTIPPADPTPTPTVHGPQVGPLTNRALPSVAGAARFGSSLTATTGSWSLTTGLSFAYQWLRDGKPIAGATKASYTPVKDDVGKSLQVRVTATSGSLKESVTSAAIAKVAKAKPVVKIKLAKKKVALGAKGTATVTVKIPGAPKPVGKLTIKVAGKKVTAKVVAKKKGKVSVRLPAIAKKGSYKVNVTFTPTAPTKAVASAGKAKASKLTVA